MRSDRNISRSPAILRSPTDPFESTVREHLERLLRSSQFDASGRSRAFLRFIVDETLAGHSEDLNQTAIAVAVFGRRNNFDATLDPIVRVQSGRLRRSLERYYLLTGDVNDIRIVLPKGGYAPVFGTPEAGHDDLRAAVKSVALAEIAADWPAVVIHSFDISSPHDEECALRVRDKLADELCQYGIVRIVCQRDIDRLGLNQQVSARFELQGHIRGANDHCSIGARLVDRSTGEQLWSDEIHTSAQPGRWSTSSDDAVRVMAARIGGEHGVIVRVLARDHCARRPDMTDAFSAILSCHHVLHSRLVGNLIPTVAALHRLTACKPETPIVWTCLANLCLVNHSFELSDLRTPVEKAIGYACEGVRLDPTAARGRCVLAATLLVKGEVQSAQDELKQALRISRDSLAYREVIGWLMALAGDWERGMALMRNAMERNPYCLPNVKQGLWADHLRRGEFEKAYIAALGYWDSSGFWRELMIACSLGHLDRLDEAQASVIELLQAKPAFRERGRTLIGYYVKAVELLERIEGGLRKAGLTLA